jgi:DNA-binding response OmpR family regulator
VNKQPILIVEDEPNIAGLIETYLEHAGFATLRAADGSRALELIRIVRPRLVILDLLLPEIDGWSVAHALRRESDIPFLILSAQKDEIDRVAGFTAGADDYVVKPFSPRELVERVRAILRRYEAGATEEQPMILRAGGLELDPGRYRVSRGRRRDRADADRVQAAAGSDAGPRSRADPRGADHAAVRRRTRRH